MINVNDNKYDRYDNNRKDIHIPRIIMQTWKNEILPKHWQASQDAIHRYMRHWNYKLMTDEDNLKFVSIYFPDFLHYFKLFEYPIQRADAIRYMWLYVHGGIYLDLDIEIKRELDDLFMEDKEVYFVRSRSIRSVYTNAFMGAKPKSPIMLDCLSEMRRPLKLWHVGKHLKVIHSTGPMMLTRVMTNHHRRVMKEEGRTIIDGSPPGKAYTTRVHELPVRKLLPCSVCDERPCEVEGSYCRVLGGSSWAGADTEFFIYMHCHWIKVTIILSIIVILLVIVYYVRKNQPNDKGRKPVSNN